MQWLSEVAKYHNDYVRVVKRLGENFYAEDLVQEMYLRLERNKRPEDIIIDGKVNQYYIYLTLRSLFLNFKKAKSQVNKINSLPLDLPNVDNSQYFEAQRRFYERIEIEINTWHKYDQLLFRLYMKGDKSMRDIADGTTISLRSIFNTITHCKERIKKNCGDDYLDLINNDLELI